MSILHKLTFDFAQKETYFAFTGINILNNKKVNKGAAFYFLFYDVPSFKIVILRTM